MALHPGSPFVFIIYLFFDIDTCSSLPLIVAVGLLIPLSDSFEYIHKRESSGDLFLGL